MLPPDNAAESPPLGRNSPSYGMADRKPAAVRTRTITHRQTSIPFSSLRTPAVPPTHVL